MGDGSHNIFITVQYDCDPGHDWPFYILDVYVEEIEGSGNFSVIEPYRERERSPAIGGFFDVKLKHPDNGLNMPNTDVTMGLDISAENFRDVIWHGSNDKINVSGRPYFLVLCVSCMLARAVGI